MFICIKLRQKCDINLLSDEKKSIPLQPVKVLTDDFEVKPFLDFDRYVDTIVRMVKGSEPNFSIGIYGEWGTGKTTLMKSIENALKSDTKKNILTIWFNAWRYETKHQFALVSLMKTIAYKMDEQPEKYVKAREVFYKSIVTAVKGLASKYVLPEKYVEELHKNLTSSNMKGLAEEDKDTIYFHGLKQIEDAMNEVLEDSPESRIVVFIDDLDRCSPKKALEVFESIKVFLGIKGFVYVIGLSHETFGKLIKAEYEKSGITGISGEQYIRKIIQIPIMVPEWNSSDIANLIENIIIKKLDERYSRLISNNKDLISIASEANPRELKRFINNFIVSNEIFSSDERIQEQQLLAVQALKVRWPNIYRELSSIYVDGEFRNSLEKYASMEYEDRIRELREVKSRQNDEKNVNREAEKRLLEIDYNLWEFLSQTGNIIFKITDWEIYRRAAESTKANLTAPVSQSRVKRDLLTRIEALVEMYDNLLLNGKIGIVEFCYDDPNTGLMGVLSDLYYGGDVIGITLQDQRITREAPGVLSAARVGLEKSSDKQTERAKIEEDLKQTVDSVIEVLRKYKISYTGIGGQSAIKNPFQWLEEATYNQ
jgi:KAP family P-loop domain